MDGVIGSEGARPAMSNVSLRARCRPALFSGIGSGELGGAVGARLNHPGLAEREGGGSGERGWSAAVGGEKTEWLATAVGEEMREVHVLLGLLSLLSSEVVMSSRKHGLAVVWWAMVSLGMGLSIWKGLAVRWSGIPYSAGLGRWTRLATAATLFTFTLPYSPSGGRADFTAPNRGRGGSAGLMALLSASGTRGDKLSPVCFHNGPKYSSKELSVPVPTTEVDRPEEAASVGVARRPIGLGLSGKGFGETSGGSKSPGDSHMSL